jgi:hypothetical protein
MDETKKPKPTIEQQIAQIEKYELNPEMKRILIQNGSFVKAVEDFYGLSTELPVSCEKFFLNDETPEKIGTYPKDLVDILNRFNSFDKSYPSLNTERLNYEMVREDSQIAKSRNIFDALKVTSYVYGPAFILAGSLPIMEHKQYPEFQSLALITGAVGLAMVGFGVIMHHLSGKGRNYSLDEYIYLHKSAQKADEFKDQLYKNPFVKKDLMTKE